MKRETVKWVAVHGVKGGHMVRVSRGDGSGCVAEEQNDLQEGFFFSRHGTFLVARASEIKFFRGYEGRYQAPQILLGPPNLIGGPRH